MRDLDKHLSQLFLELKRCECQIQETDFSLKILHETTTQEDTKNTAQRYIECLSGKYHRPSYIQKQSNLKLDIELYIKKLENQSNNIDYFRYLISRERMTIKIEKQRHMCMCINNATNTTSASIKVPSSYFRVSDRIKKSLIPKIEECKRKLSDLEIEECNLISSYKKKKKLEDERKRKTQENQRKREQQQRDKLEQEKQQKQQKQRQEQEQKKQQQQRDYKLSQQRIKEEAQTQKVLEQQRLEHEKYLSEKALEIEQEQFIAEERQKERDDIANEKQRQRDYELRKIELELQLQETKLMREREAREQNQASIDSLRESIKAKDN